MREVFEIAPIGVIHSPYMAKEACPIQGRADPEGAGRVEVFPEYEQGLETIETFTHIILFYIFDRAGKVILSRPTFLDDSNHGIFASRHPCRPSRLGMSVVRLTARKGAMLEIRGVDVLDQTPLIDIKPYIPRFDLFPDAGNGWVEGLSLQAKPKGRE